MPVVVAAIGSLPSAPPASDEPARPRHLDDRRAAVQPPLGLDRVAERTGHDGAAVGPAEHVEQSLAAVGEGDLVAVVAELPARVADGGGRRRRPTRCP